MVKRVATMLVEQPVLKRQKTMKRTKTVDARLKQLSSKVSKISRSIESNYVDTSINMNANYDTSNVLSLTTITNDSATSSGAPGTRQGSRVTPTFLELRMQVSQSSSTLQNPSVVRIVVVQAKQRFVPSGTAAGGSTALLAYQNASAVVYSPFDKFNRQHFTVLHDETLTLGSWLTSTGVATDIDQTKLVEFKRKLSRDIRFEDDSGNPEAGRIYLVAYSTIATANTEPTLFGYARVHYQDL